MWPAKAVAVTHVGVLQIDDTMLPLSEWFHGDLHSKVSQEPSLCICLPY